MKLINRSASIAMMPWLLNEASLTHGNGCGNSPEHNAWGIYTSWKFKCTYDEPPSIIQICCWIGFPSASKGADISNTYNNDAINMKDYFPAGKILRCVRTNVQTAFIRDMTYLLPKPKGAILGSAKTIHRVRQKIEHAVSRSQKSIGSLSRWELSPSR